MPSFGLFQNIFHEHPLSAILGARNRGKEGTGDRVSTLRRQHAQYCVISAKTGESGVLMSHGQYPAEMNKQALLHNYHGIVQRHFVE